MKIYKSKTCKYRIVEFTMVNETKKYSVEFKFAGILFELLMGWRFDKEFSSFQDCEQHVLSCIEKENKRYENNTIKSSRVL